MPSDKAIELYGVSDGNVDTIFLARYVRRGSFLFLIRSLGCFLFPRHLMRKRFLRRLVLLWRTQLCIVVDTAWSALLSCLGGCVFCLSFLSPCGCISTGVLLCVFGFWHIGLYDNVMCVRIVSPHTGHCHLVDLLFNWPEFGIFKLCCSVCEDCLLDFAFAVGYFNCFSDHSLVAYFDTPSFVF